MKDESHTTERVTPKVWSRLPKVCQWRFAMATFQSWPNSCRFRYLINFHVFMKNFVFWVFHVRTIKMMWSVEKINLKKMSGWVCMCVLKLRKIQACVSMISFSLKFIYWLGFYDFNFFFKCLEPLITSNRAN